MKTRAQQREETRRRIVRAARRAFADLGFRGASTRDIAARARTTQGLVTYHFPTKDDLWKAAVAEMFSELRGALAGRLATREIGEPRAVAKAAITEFVRYAAAHPDLFRLLVDQGKHPDKRMRWLVDTQLKPIYERFLGVGAVNALGFEAELKPHVYYVLAGAASVIFAVAPECRRLTGVDPADQAVVEAHARFVADLLVP